MNIFVPSYYPDFACIAGKCRHTCCKGWEIDVDADTYEAIKKRMARSAKDCGQALTRMGVAHIFVSTLRSVVLF